MSAINLKSLLQSQPKWSTICIPKIQRDYAEGRETDSVKKKRVNMLTDMLDVVLGNKNDLSLDFVYGIADNGKFKPLDGQQRLTTLFILHWMLGRNEDLKDAHNHSLFVYETRKTSEEFCHWLVNQDAKTILDAWIQQVQDTEATNNQNKNLWDTETNDKGKVDKIANRLAYPLAHVPSLFEHFAEMDEFKWDWHIDPNIHSMIIVIETACQIIKDKGCDLSQVQINSTKLDDITFELLDNLICDGDALFEKMNARGKELSSYDLLKSSLEEELEIQKSPIIDYWRHNIDNDWIDYCWDSSNLPISPTLKDVKKVEQRLERLLTRIMGKTFFMTDVQYTKPIGGGENPGQMLEACIFKDCDNVANNYFKYARFERGKKSTSSYSFSQIDLQEVYDDINHLIYKDHSNTWKDIAWYLHSQGLRIHADNNNTLLDDFLNDALDHQTRVMFYAMAAYLKQVNAQTLISNPIEFDNFKDWMRFARNAFLAANKNVRIDNPNRVKEAIKAIDSWLDDFFSNYYQGLSNQEMLAFIAGIIVNKANGQEQACLDEEALKASLRMGNPNASGMPQQWEKAILSAEDNPYLWGQIVAPLSWSEVGGKYDLQRFIRYVEKLSDLFTAPSLNAKTDMLLIQACLSMVNYRFNGNAVWGSLGTANDNRDISWKRHLRDKRSGVYGERIKNLIDLWIKSHPATDCETFLKTVISSNLPSFTTNDFRYLFCNIGEMDLSTIFKDVVRTDARYINEASDGHCYVYRSTQQRADAIRYELLTLYLFARKNISTGLSTPTRIDHFNGPYGAFVELQKAKGYLVRVTSAANGEYEISFNGKPIHTSKDVTDVGKWLMSLRIISSL